MSFRVIFSFKVQLGFVISTKNSKSRKKVQKYHYESIRFFISKTLAKVIHGLNIHDSWHICELLYVYNVAYDMEYFMISGNITL